jgi:hypothetical protein
MLVRYWCLDIRVYACMIIGLMTFLCSVFCLAFVLDCQMHYGFGPDTTHDGGLLYIPMDVEVNKGIFLDT